MWAAFSPHTLFNGICCPAVVCVSWHQQQRKSTLGLRGLVLLVCLCRSGFFFFFFFPELTAIKALLTQWSVGQSSWTHLLASDEKKLCLHASRFLSVISIFALSLKPPSCLCLFSLKRNSGGQVIYIFCFHFPPNTSTRGRKQSDALSHWAHPAHPPTIRQLGCEREREKDKGDYFIKRIVILGGQSIIDEVKKQWWLFFFTVRVGSHCLWVNRIDLMETRLLFFPSHLLDIMLNKCIIHSLV